MKKKYKLYAYTALAALFTHYFLIGVVIFQALFIYRTSHRRERDNFFSPLIKAFLWYIPWILLLLFARPPMGQSFWIESTFWKDVFILPAIILTGYERASWIVVPFLSYISAIVCIIIIFGSLRFEKHHKKVNFFLLVGWALVVPLVVFILSFIKPVFLPRYLIFSSVGITLLLIVSLENIRNKYIRSLFFAILIFFLLSYTSIQIIMRTKAPLKKLYGSISKEMRESDVVYVTHEYDFHPAQYYLPTKKVYIYNKTYEELPWFVGKVLIDKQAIRTTLPLYPVRAFIVNNDGSYSIMAR